MPGYNCSLSFLLTPILPAGDLAGSGGDGVCPRGLVARGAQHGQLYSSHSELLQCHQFPRGLAQDRTGKTEAVQEVVQSTEGEFITRRYM